MNFFQRRKILKKTSYTDLIPVRILESVQNEQGKTDVLVPRFKNEYLKRAMQSKHKGDHIIIHLDETGSIVWNSIDGIMNVSQIIQKISESYPEKFSSADETPVRVMKFISLLYQERYITFRQLIVIEQ